MTPVLAILRQTCRAAVRSRVVLVLFLLTIVAVAVLPLAVSGDGTAIGEFQVAMVYSLRAVTLLASLAAIWLGCAGLSREIENYTLHMVVTKPASPAMVWFGKWLGVTVITGGVFVVAAAAIYGLLLIRIQTATYPADEMAQVRQELLVGRAAYQPLVPDFAQAARAAYAKRLAEGTLQEGHDPGLVLQELQRQIKAASTEVPVGAGRGWPFDGLRVSAPDQPVYVRYRMYMGSKQSSNQRETIGRWMIINPDAPAEEQTVSSPVLKMMTGSFQEFSFPSQLLSPKGRAIVLFENLDPENGTLVFQTDDGPTLLVRSTGFLGNWLRATVVGGLRVMVMAALGCVFGALFHTPVAIFVSFAYLLLGAILDPKLGEPTRDMAGNITAWPVRDMISYIGSRVVGWAVVGFRDFDVTRALSRGALISGGLITRLLVWQVLARAVPLVALGIWIFRRRELGKVIRR